MGFILNAMHTPERAEHSRNEEDALRYLDWPAENSSWNGAQCLSSILHDDISSTTSTPLQRKRSGTNTDLDDDNNDKGSRRQQKRRQLLSDSSSEESGNVGRGNKNHGGTEMDADDSILSSPDKENNDAKLSIEEEFQLSHKQQRKTNGSELSSKGEEDGENIYYFYYCLLLYDLLYCIMM